MANTIVMSFIVFISVNDIFQMKQKSWRLVYSRLSVLSWLARTTAGFAF
jgi:hypothetical protein